jgi:hypothetical protein
MTLEQWEARAGRDIGAFLHNYLLTHPAPEDCEYARRLQRIPDFFLEAGRLEHESVGVAPLVAIRGGGDA